MQKIGHKGYRDKQVWTLMEPYGASQEISDIAISGVPQFLLSDSVRCCHNRVTL